MTDRLKGILVTFEKDIREDDAEKILTAIKMIRGVLSVKNYVVGAEDYILYHRGQHEIITELKKWQDNMERNICQKK